MHEALDKKNDPRQREPKVNPRSQNIVIRLCTRRWAPKNDHAPTLGAGQRLMHSLKNCLKASILVVAFFSISSSQPLLSQICLRRRESKEFHTTSQALGIPDSGVLAQSEPISRIDPNEPLDKLLLNKRFRQSFMAIADSCLAGESVHFFDEVYELRKIPKDDCVRRIYMARHIIEKYVVADATMEVNISYRSRQEILSTSNLACPDLFHNSLNEIIQLMRTNLACDYWSSMFFLKFQEDSNARSNEYELEQMIGWNFSPRLSSVHDTDDPFHQDHLLKSSGCSNDTTDL